MEVSEAEYRMEGLMRKRGIYHLAAAVVIGFCVGLRGEYFYLTSLKRMLQFWEEMRNKNNCFAYHGGFKGVVQG